MMSLLPQVSVPVMSNSVSVKSFTDTQFSSTSDTDTCVFYGCKRTRLETRSEVNGQCRVGLSSRPAKLIRCVRNIYLRYGLNFLIEQGNSLYSYTLLVDDINSSLYNSNIYRVLSGVLLYHFLHYSRAKINTSLRQV